MKLLHKNKHGGDGISNFRPLTTLNTDLKILAKILANRLQTVLPRSTIIEKVDGNAALINLDQSKALVGSTTFSGGCLVCGRFWVAPGSVSFMHPPESWWR